MKRIFQTIYLIHNSRRVPGIWYWVLSPNYSTGDLINSCLHADKSFPNLANRNQFRIVTNLIGAQYWGPPWNSSDHHSAIVLRDLRGKSSIINVQCGKPQTNRYTHRDLFRRILLIKNNFGLLSNIHDRFSTKQNSIQCQIYRKSVITI